jgi:hypothetical protein
MLRIVHPNSDLIGEPNFRFWNTILFARTAKDFYKDNIYFDISATVTQGSKEGSLHENPSCFTVARERKPAAVRLLFGRMFDQANVCKWADLSQTSGRRPSMRTFNPLRLVVSARNRRGCSNICHFGCRCHLIFCIQAQKCTYAEIRGISYAQDFLHEPLILNRWRTDATIAHCVRDRKRFSSSRNSISITTDQWNTR